MKTSRLFSLVIVMIMAFSSVLVFAADSSAVAKAVDSKNYYIITWNGTLNMYGESSITLPSDMKKVVIDGMSVERSGKIIPSEMSISKQILTVSPAIYYEAGAVYNIKLFATDGKRYIINAKVQDYIKFDNSKYAIIKISPKPSMGFNYSYYLYIPENIAGMKDRRLLVHGNNSNPSNVQEYFEECAYRSASSYFTAMDADELRIPLLFPSFPRDYGNEIDYCYMQYLNRGSLSTNDPSEKRVDLQLIAMIKDAQKELAYNNITIPSKVFIEGFSADGKFAQRFTILHPDYVMAAVAGGIAGTCTLPLESYNKTPLPYPIGVSDLKELVGSEFNATEFKKVPQLFYMGGLDTNDGTQWRDCYSDSEAKTIWTLFGEKMLPDRWNNTQKILNLVAPQIQFKTYQELGHEINIETQSYIQKYFKDHWSR